VRKGQEGFLAVWIFVMMIVMVGAIFSAGFGFGAPREGTYTGNVVDVSTQGWIWKVSEVELRTSPESSETESFCIPQTAHGEQLREELKQALESGQRVQISYDQGMFNPPWKCDPMNAPIDSVETGGLVS